MKELKIPFKVWHGQFGFGSADRDKLEVEFLEFNEGKEGEIIYRTIERDIQYYQHKYYRGFLVPPIANDSYSGNRFETHLRLKEMFLVVAVSSFFDIPTKHQERAIPVYDYFIENNEIIKKTLCGYIPSTKDIAESEMRKFILDVELFAAEAGIELSLKAHEYEYRKRALG